MQEPATFEAAMKELETIVQQLNNNELSLDDSIKAYEKGVELSRFCQEKLETAKVNIQEVNQKGQETEF